MCVCVCVWLVETSQVVGSGPQSGFQSGVGFVVLGSARSSWEAKVAAGKRPFRTDRQARVKGDSTHCGLLQQPWPSPSERDMTF